MTTDQDTWWSTTKDGKIIGVQIIPVHYPTVQEVKRAFADAIPQSSEFDQERYEELFRTSLPAWTRLGEFIETNGADGAVLVRVTWRFIIDKMCTSSESGLKESAMLLQQQLRDLVGDRIAAFQDLEFRVDESPATTVTCSTRGMIF